MEVLAEEECLTADGFDAAWVGCNGANVVAVYDIQRMIEVLVNEGMDHDDAVEFLEYNVVSAYLGDKTLIIRKLCPTMERSKKPKTTQEDSQKGSQSKYPWWRIGVLERNKMTSLLLGGSPGTRSK